MPCSACKRVHPSQKNHFGSERHSSALMHFLAMSNKSMLPYQAV